MYHQSGMDKVDLNQGCEEQSGLIRQSSLDGCCAICQRMANDYYQHWACLKSFAICESCYSNLRMIQCSNCKGVGASADIVINQKISSNVRLCPACQDSLLGTRGSKPFAI
jgi:hypothetical protein